MLLHEVTSPDPAVETYARFTYLVLTHPLTRELARMDNNDRPIWGLISTLSKEDGTVLYVDMHRKDDEERQLHLRRLVNTIEGLAARHLKQEVDVLLRDGYVDVRLPPTTAGRQRGKIIDRALELLGDET
jgi:hypothetical protein